MKKGLLIILILIFGINIFSQDEKKKEKKEVKKEFLLISIDINHYLDSKTRTLILNISHLINAYNDFKKKPLLRNKTKKRLINLLTKFENKEKRIKYFLFNNYNLFLKLESNDYQLLLIKKHKKIFYYFIKRKEIDELIEYKDLRKITDIVDINMPIKIRKPLSYNIVIPQIEIYDLILSNDYRKILVFPFYKKLNYNTKYSIYIFYNIYNYYFENVIKRIAINLFPENFIKDLKIKDIVRFEIFKISNHFLYPLISKREKEICFLNKEFKEKFLIFEDVKTDIINLFISTLLDKDSYFKDNRINLFPKIFMLNMISNLIMNEKESSKIEFSFFYSAASFSIDIRLVKIFVDIESLKLKSKSILSSLLSYSKSCNYSGLESFISKYSEVNQDMLDLFKQKLKAIKCNLKFKVK